MNYIPESQPLFEKEDGAGAKDAQPASATSPQDTPLTNDGVGAGMAAVRAMYLNPGAVGSTEKDASPARINAVPFQSVVESPEISKDLFNSLNAESQIVHSTPVETFEPISAPTPDPSSASVATEPAPPAEVWVQCFDEESGWPYVYNEVTGEVKWVEPESTDQLMAELWEVCYDEDGNQFYYNSVRIYLFATYFSCIPLLTRAGILQLCRQRVYQAGTCQRTQNWRKVAGLERELGSTAR